MGDKIAFYDLQYKGFTLFIVSMYILYAFSIIGLSRKAPEYIQTLDSYVKIYICLFLIYRFNPFRSKINFTELDRRIVFSAGLFILATTAINKIVISYLDIIKKKIMKSLPKKQEP
jgi:hypothetical protein